MEDNIYSVYTLGSADPRVVFGSPSVKISGWERFKNFFSRKKPVTTTSKRRFSTFSGVDIKLFFEYKDGSVSVLPEIQTFSIEEKNSSVKGEFISIVFDRSNLENLKKTENVAIVACNEYGALSAAAVKGVDVERYRSGVSIDDIVSKENIAFSAEKYIPFVSWSDRFENEESRTFWLWIDDVKSRAFNRRNK